MRRYIVRGLSESPWHTTARRHGALLQLRRRRSLGGWLGSSG
jgi:hypothetical protein